MADLEARIGGTLRLVREAIRVLEADPEMFREAIERIQKANASPLAIPRDTPDVILREIERVLASAVVHLEGWQPAPRNAAADGANKLESASGRPARHRLRLGSAMRHTWTTDRVAR